MRRGFGVVAAAICLMTRIASAGTDTASIRLETTKITVRYRPVELDSPIAARILLKRIEDAALESCGASTFSLTEFKAATKLSACWRSAVRGAVRRIDSPALNAAAYSGGR